MLLFLASLVLLGGCGGANEQARTSAVDETLTSPQAQALEASLQDMEGRASEVRAKIDRAQGIISSHMKPEDLDDLTKGQGDGAVYIEIDAATTLRVNGVMMSQDDLARLIDVQGQQICQPVPVLVSDPEARYEMVAWVLDQIYAQSCAEVDLIEKTPASLGRP